LSVKDIVGEKELVDFLEIKVDCSLQIALKIGNTDGFVGAQLFLVPRWGALKRVFHGGDDFISVFVFGFVLHFMSD
jgi:hypothetical protein